jgi:type IV pilus assembly protein PilY1
MKRYQTTAITTATLLVSSAAVAQTELNQLLPNVLLLVDSSGSMEYMPDGSLPTTCDPAQSSDLNRWGTLLTVLTGTIQNRGCYKQFRTGAQFIAEYSIGGVEPYDTDYFLPYHRYLSNGCVPTPGDLPPNAFDWSPNPIEYRPYANLNGSCAPTEFQQSNDGLLDTYRDRVRFGLFTFDTHAHAGNGVSGTSHQAQNGFKGLWSYYVGWQGGGTPAGGNPPDCDLQTHEVGARNFAAPPWEGRMIPFGDPSADINQVRFLNARIQEGLVAMRPYGATPLAGMMADAHAFFREDTSMHPLDSSQPFAPAADPMVLGGCRESYVIVLSDGEPNMDLRPYCQAGNGVCPYAEPYEYAKDLATPLGNFPGVKTFAVGFGLSSTSNFDCSTLQMPHDLQAGGACDGATGSLKACCTLSRIAYEGGTDRAYFADDITTLKTALSAVLDQIASATTSRTLPTFATATATLAGSSQAPAVSYEFNSSFSPKPGELWRGSLERKRWRCESINGSLQPVLKPVETSKGDDFSLNVNDGKLVKPRKFYTVIGDLTSNKVRSRSSIRPALDTDDGLGIYKGTTESGNNSLIASKMQTRPEAMELSPIPAACNAEDLQASTPGECAYRVMNWELGGTNSGLPSRVGNEFGAIYHATPAVSDAPRQFIRDPAYERFAELKATRPLVLYTATIDGQLHAFKVAPNNAQDVEKADSLRNNELWAFLPPYVLPGIISQYPGSSQILLDGAPVVKDIPFERTLAQAQASGTSSGADWRTVLVAGGYLGGGFYYALDVTDPENPEFLWQLSTSASDEPLFGTISGTPAITTVSMKEGVNVKEIAVAILPGGEGALMAQNCSSNRQATSFPHIDPSYQPRAAVRCWQSGPSRSLTIVRLRDGMILKTFRGAASDGPSSINSALVEDAPFDSPITGTPVPFPAQAGQVATRIYVGDADGTLWRVDLSNPDPDAWRVDMAFDAYPSAGDGAEDGQPIATTPVMAVDGQGNTVIVLSTGDQEDFTSTDIRARAWSITELPEAVGSVPFKIDVNWVLGGPDGNNAFQSGEKVTGPMAIFDGVVYFSTFTPPGTGGNVCAIGYGRLWGVDFVAFDSGTIGPKPEARLPDGPTSFKYSEDLGANVTPFGVAVTAEPSCTEEATVGDDFVGQHTMITSSVPPVFKLRFQSGSSGTKDPGSSTNTGELLLPQPRSQTFIDSWASVVE